MEEMVVIVGGCSVVLLSLLIMKFRGRLGTLTSRYAIPSLDAETYTAIWRGIGVAGICIGGLWIVVALVRLL